MWKIGSFFQQVSAAKWSIKTEKRIELIANSYDPERLNIITNFS